jgi:cobalamin biosynthesis protein CobC
VGVFGFTYGEHCRVWNKAGRDTRIVNNLSNWPIAISQLSSIPITPTAVSFHLLPCMSSHWLESVKNGVLIVDEAFMDLVQPTQSFIPSMPKTGTIILRSFGNRYGLAGLRLGCGVISPDLAPRGLGTLGYLGRPAIAVGCHALAHHAWLEATLLRLQINTVRLDKLLTNAGFTIAGGTLLYGLARMAGAGWFARLGQAGILVRPFTAKPDWLRLGIPHHEQHWARLKQALDG